VCQVFTHIPTLGSKPHEPSHNHDGEKSPGKEQHDQSLYLSVYYEFVAKRDEGTQSKDKTQQENKRMPNQSPQRSLILVFNCPIRERLWFCSIATAFFTAVKLEGIA
jgi:hypothetical protein